MVRGFIIGVVVVAMVACSEQSPQRPSRRMGQAPQADSAQLALLSLNQQLTETADETLHRLAQAQEEPYALYENGTWAYLIDPGDATRGVPAEGEECTVHMRIFSLEGHLYSDIEQTAHAGKYELPGAVDANIGEWNHGTKARLLAPWYAAYGIKGTDDIPPYENVIIELELK
ncbi:MAG: hypothetical protein IJS57_02140 [Paludibacteraceae bacterium]|nr:hypothetical protein [Paludibacteraceae bacterium]